MIIKKPGFMKNLYYSSLFILSILYLTACASQKKSKNRTYDYSWYPKKFAEIQKHYENYAHFLGCKSGETIASIGAGNGTNEVAISCFVEDINWYLQEIDSGKLSQFHEVLVHFEKLNEKEVHAKFELVLGTATATNLPQNHFDRIIMNNVYHELSDRKAIMEDISGLLKQNGQLVIMEPMARKPGEKHANCNHLRLYDPDFLMEMEQFGYNLAKKEVGEKLSFLTYYTFTVF